MPEETIEYDKIKDYNPTEKATSLTIQNVPSTEMLSVEQLYELSLKLSDNGTFKLIFNSSLNDELISQIKSNLIFSGLTNIISNSDSKEIICTKKEWPNNSVNEYKDLDPKNITEGPGVDPSHLIDPYTTYKPKLKYVPVSNAKPCANCVCGRAAALKKEKNNNENEQKVEIKDNKGGCGRCHLSDEFRCANCPYRGLPAFNKNDLDKGKEQNQNQNQEIENIKKEVKNNVVKIEV